MSGVRAASLQPPVGGWDTLSALADMPPQNAIELVNWFPLPDRVETRGGYTNHVTGFAEPVETLMMYRPPSGADRILAASGGSIYDATTAGAVGGAMATGYTSARWQYVQASTAGGHFIIAVNGADAPQQFNGTAWTAAGIAGPTVANLAWINIHQKRVWTGERNSLVAWYLAPNAISGTAVQFDFTSVATLGGSIVAMGTWTRDGGSGVDDVAAFITSEGQVLLYAGTDPSSLSTWGQLGVFRVGRPLGRRCFVQFGADLGVMTEDGIVMLSQVLPVDRSQQSAAAVSRQINSAVTDAARAYGPLNGWEPLMYPARNMAIFNVPTANGAFDQYVFNTLTRAPARFTGVPAQCWGLAGANAYFGSANAVCRFDDGANDAGTPITASAVQAFNGFGIKPQKKLFRRARVVLRSSARPLYSVDMLLDYKTTRLPPPLQTANQDDAYWDSAVWDRSKWADEINIEESRGIRGIGRMGALRVRCVTSAARVSWLATDVQFVPGGLL